MNYTSENLKACQYDAAVRQLYLINKNLKKISKSLTVLAILGIGAAIYQVRELKNVKGE